MHGKRFNEREYLLSAAGCLFETRLVAEMTSYSERKLGLNVVVKSWKNLTISAAMSIFVSSTCHDLIDLRAELEVFFREAGVRTVLSDSLTSDFQVAPDQNSIETCLANVRNCDEFLIVLSQRYGPSLGPNFGNKSATHLEYDEAVKHNKRIRMYVRDRLEGDYNSWKNNQENQDLKLSWCRRQDWKIFELLKEHRTLTESETRNNWFWIFRNSVELKQHLISDFKEAISRVTVTRLFENGRVPFLQVTGSVQGTAPQGVRFNVEIRNLGAVPAISPILRLSTDSRKLEFPSLANQERASQEDLTWAWIPGAPLELVSRLSYSTLEGHHFIDQGEMTIMAEPGSRKGTFHYRLNKRQYVDASPEMIPTTK